MTRVTTRKLVNNSPELTVVEQSNVVPVWAKFYRIASTVRIFRIVHVSATAASKDPASLFIKSRNALLIVKRVHC